jgi:excisionase family DNA binding protein
VKLYYTVSEAALALNMAPSKIRSMIGLGEIQTVEISGGWKRIPRSEITRLRKTEGIPLSL